MVFLMRDILDLAQLEANSFILNKSSVNLDDLIRECVSMLNFKAIDKKIDLQVKNPSEVIFVLTDPQRVQQILINLLSNAIKYTEEYGVVKVSVLKYRNPNST